MIDKDAAYNHPSQPNAAALSVEARVEAAMRDYLEIDLGLDPSSAKQRASQEISGYIGRAVLAELAAAEISIQAKVVLELGAGLGSLSRALASESAFVIALEPGEGWRLLAKERLDNSPNAHVVGGTGEFLPVRSASVDVIVSRQVLEHVRNPKRVIAEAYRVLRPGGLLYLTYENYFSFWEPHYRVPWLPMLPKTLGAQYLRIIRWPPKFLHDSITYTTFSSVRKALLGVGFQCLFLRKQQRGLSDPAKASAKWQALKYLSRWHHRSAVNLLRSYGFVMRFMKTNVCEIMQKPADAIG